MDKFDKIELTRAFFGIIIITIAKIKGIVI